MNLCSKRRLMNIQSGVWILYTLNIPFSQQPLLYITYISFPTEPLSKLYVMNMLLCIWTFRRQNIPLSQSGLYTHYISVPHHSASKLHLMNTQNFFWLFHTRNSSLSQGYTSYIYAHRLKKTFSRSTLNIRIGVWPLCILHIPFLRFLPHAFFATAAGIDFNMVVLRMRPFAFCERILQ